MRLLACLLALVALGAAPPAHPTPDQRRLVAERNAHMTRANEAHAARDRAALASHLGGVLAVERRLFGEAHARTLQTRRNLSGLHADAGRWDDAICQRREIVAGARALYGRDHWRVADAVVALAEARAAASRPEKARRDLADATRLHEDAERLHEKGKYDDGAEAAARCLALREAALGPMHVDVAEALNDLAALHHARGDDAQAIPLLRRALSIRERVLGPDHPLTVTLLNNLGLSLQFRGEYAAAARLLEAALPRIARLRGPRHPETLNAVNNLGMLVREMGDPARALRMFRRLVPAVREEMGPRSAFLATALTGMGEALMSSARFREAYTPLLAAARLRKDLLGPKHPHYAASVRLLGVCCREMGDYRQALLYYQYAVATTKRTLGERHPLHAQALQGLAVLYTEMGDDKAALPLFRRVADLEKDGGRASGPLRYNALNSLGLSVARTGDLKEAVGLLTEALALARKTHGERHPAYANCLNNLAVTLTAAGDPRGGAKVFAQALAIFTPAVGEHHPDTLAARMNLLQTRLIFSVVPSADFKRLAAFMAEAQGREAPQRARCLRLLALRLRREGRPLEALAAADEAARLTRRSLDNASETQSERQQLAVLNDAGMALDMRLSMPERDGGRSYAHVLAWKGAVFEGERRRRVLRQLVTSSDPDAARIASELEGVNARLAALALRPDARRRAAELAELSEAKDYLEGTLAGLTTQNLLSPPAPEADAVAAALPRGAVLFDFLVYLHAPEKGEHRREVAVWVTRPGRRTLRLALGRAEPVEAAITAWRKELVSGGGAAEAAAVTRLVWAPLAAYAAGAETVLISPDGALARLPWAALPGRKKGTFLLEDVALAVVPVPAALAGKPGGRAAKPSLLAVGGVKFDGPRGAGDGRWAPLPATRPEADTAAAQFASAFPAAPVTRLSDDSAGKGAVREALAGRSHLHLATHGYFAGADTRSAFDVRGEGRGIAGDVIAGFHPGLLSGLVLAGANSPSETDDGVLTATELAGLDLSHVQLAVLSACETGLGKEAGGEGLLGLQRAFAVAGCRGVVSSLWSVHDAATCVLMERFYHHLWKGKLARHEALRRAQIDVLRNPGWVSEREKKLVAELGTTRGIRTSAKPLPDKATRSPAAWWAAWQLSGDWR